MTDPSARSARWRVGNARFTDSPSVARRRDRAVLRAAFAGLLFGGAFGVGPAAAKAVVPAVPLDDLIVRPHDWQPMPRPAPAEAVEAAAAGDVAPSGSPAATDPPATVPSVVPPVPLDGLIPRPEGWRALPRRAPSLAESAGRTCTPRDAELEWARLPRSLRQASLEAMIGQLLVVSFTGKAPDDPGVAAARDALAASRVGGVLFFRGNVGTAVDVRATNALLTAAPFADGGIRLVPFLSIDQEGGAVMRVKPTEGAPATPSARTLSAGTTEEARIAYAAMADTLAALGFTVNFGPVVDLAIEPDNPVVAKYGRSYGADPATVVRFAEAFVDAHRSAGVATALKHFPGHGSTRGDSHDGAIDLSPTFRRAELAPFRELIAQDAADMVMIGHLALDGLTGDDGLPASLSPAAIGFLREEFCFGGIVVSDDLAMDAIAARHPPAEAVRLMLAAGGDVALLSLPGDAFATADAIVAEIAATARTDTALADRIRHAFARVANGKLTLAERRTRTLASID